MGGPRSRGNLPHVGKAQPRGGGLRGRSEVSDASDRSDLSDLSDLSDRSDRSDLSDRSDPSLSPR